MPQEERKSLVAPTPKMLAFATLMVRAATRSPRLVARGAHAEARLAELGLELPPLGEPKGSYVRGDCDE